MSVSIITLLAPIVGDLVKKLIPDADKAKDIDKEVKLALLDHTDSLESIRGSIVLSETKSDSWLTATWRPLLMMVIVSIVAMNYLIFPLIGLMFGVELMIDLPEELWSLLQIGVGGYVVGRSGEKMIEKWSNPK
jgi:hypothetical protein